MIAHYFGVALSPSQLERIEVLLPEAGTALQLTPAAMEQACAEHDDVDTMLDELLARMSGPMLVPGRAVSRMPSRR